MKRDEKIIEQLSQTGIAKGTARASLELDAVMQRWRRRANKRELGRTALAELGLDLELPELDALVAVWAPDNEFGTDSAEETTVGAVAQRLGIDPSRASRLTAALIDKGLVARDVSQQDSRRTVLEPTEAGDQIVEAVRMHKLLVLGAFLADWSEDDIRTFVPLFERFSAWTDDAHQHSAGASAEIERLRRDLTTETATADS